MTNVRRATAGDERLYAKICDVAAWGDKLSGFMVGITTWPKSRLQLPQLETLLKRLIPVLILAFLIVVAASRILGIVAESGRMEESARQATALSALAAKAALMGDEVLFATQDRTAAETRLGRAFPAGGLNNNTLLLIAGNDGRILLASATKPPAISEHRSPVCCRKSPLSGVSRMRPAPSRPISKVHRITPPCCRWAPMAA